MFGIENGSFGHSVWGQTLITRSHVFLQNNEKRRLLQAAAFFSMCPAIPGLYFSVYCPSLWAASQMSFMQVS